MSDLSHSEICGIYLYITKNRKKYSSLYDRYCLDKDLITYSQLGKIGKTVDMGTTYNKYSVYHIFIAYN